MDYYIGLITGCVFILPCNSVDLCVFGLLVCLGVALDVSTVYFYVVCVSCSILYIGNVLSLKVAVTQVC